MVKSIIMKLLISNFLYIPVALSPLDPIFSLASCSQTRPLCFSPRLTDLVLHPHKTAKLIILYILILKFLDRRWQDSELYGSKHSPVLFTLIFFMNRQQCSNNHTWKHATLGGSTNPWLSA